MPAQIDNSVGSIPHALQLQEVRHPMPVAESKKWLQETRLKMRRCEIEKIAAQIYIKRIAIDA
jgi:hypothetical protein